MNLDNMEEGLGDPLTVAKEASLIKEAQVEIGKLDILLCGTCQGVFHFVEEFNTHKSDKCSEASATKSCENDDKAHAWAFCLWKNKEMRSLSSEKNLTTWSIYQKWCKLSQEIRNSWIACGETLLSLNKIRIAKMQEVKFKVKREEEKDPLALTDNDMQSLDDKEDKNNVIKPTPHTKSSKAVEIASNKKDSKKDKDELNEYVVESILGKRFNAKKKHWEYKVKWENWDESQCSWEPTEHLTGCKSLIQRFEEKLKLEKEKKKAPESPKLKPKTEIKTDDESTEYGLGRRPQRSSKQKALSQVKRWLGEGSDNEDSNKRSHEEDDSDQSFEKRMKLEEESEESDEDDEDEKQKKVTPAKLRNTSNGLAGKKIPHNVLIPDAQGIVRINQKQLPSLSSGVYIMSKTAGIIKLDSQTSKIAASGGQAVVKVAPRIGQTHIRIVKKDGGTTNRVIQMSPKSKLSSQASTPRGPMTHRVTKVVRHMSSNLRVSKADSKIEEQKKTNKDENKMVQSADEDDSDSGLPELEFPSEIIIPEPEEPPSEFTLDPSTGKIAGVEYPDPEPEPEISTEDNKESCENTLDNIVKLAAADITEADLKPDLSEPMETDMTQNNDMPMHEQQQNILEMEDKKPEINKEVIKMRKEPSNLSRLQQKFMISPNLKNSNILERTLQTPRTVVKSPQGYGRQVYAAKSPQRILNSTMTPKLISPMNPMVRTVVRSGYSSKPKQMFPKQRIYMSSPSSKFNESIIKQSYPKSNVNKRVGNIGSTTIYKRTPQQNRLSSSPKVVSRTSMVRKSMPVVRSVVQKTPKPVISMPSLMDDDLPAQTMPETIQMVQKTEPIDDTPEATSNLMSAGVSSSEADLSSFTMNDEEAPIFITGDDGTVYQVAGQNEQGQTILFTQGPDGQQQCLLVTSDNAAQEEAPQEESTAQLAPAVVGEEMPVQQSDLIGETQVAEAVQDPQEPLSIKTEPDTDQIVAHVVRAEPPSPGGTHKVVVMLPDGNLMETQITPEEYASLELDKQ
ncbi:hypothetical protein WA026_016089 [Henosepilachna vigintioctopunctata]|uniref:Chromo domain-containing protein n=1 Tax=Henosepilachna vigintioctopunctata TaxID=420089 RepID=A0AAW1U7Q1_9CUCU